MKPYLALLPAFLMIGTSSQASSAANPEEAQRLVSVFQSYLGSEPGVVTINPSGDSYAVKLDFAPLFTKIKEPGTTVSLSPLEWTLTDQGGGKWKVDQNQPLSFAFKIEGKLDMIGSIGSISGTGIFDESLGAFASTSSEFKQIGFGQTMTEQGRTSKVDYTIASLSMKSNMSGSESSADGTATYAFTDLRETISMPAAPDGSMPAMDVSIASPSGTQEATVKGLRPKALNALLAWFVAHPSEQAIIAGQAELKDKLVAALPLFSSIAGTSTLEKLTVNTMMGKFEVDKFGFEIGANGIVADGAAREKFSFTGLTLPEGIVPPWAAGLVPKDFNIDIGASGFDLAAPARILIDNLDLSKNPPLPKDVEPRLAAAFMPKGSVDITLGTSEIIAKVFNLKANGSMKAGPAIMPAGQATVSLKGIDDILAALQSAPPEMGMQQIAPVALIAKGMGKQEADGSLSWKIESTPTGSVTINGIDPMKMGGQ
jgi:hypothetical protein